MIPRGSYVLQTKQFMNWNMSKLQNNCKYAFNKHPVVRPIRSCIFLIEVYMYLPGGWLIANASMVPYPQRKWHQERIYTPESDFIWASNWFEEKFARPSRATQTKHG